MPNQHMIASRKIKKDKSITQRVYKPTLYREALDGLACKPNSQSSDVIIKHQQVLDKKTKKMIKA